MCCCFVVVQCVDVMFQMCVMQYVSGCEEDNFYDLDWCWYVQWMINIKLVKQIGVFSKVGIYWVIVGINYGYVVQ